MPTLYQTLGSNTPAYGTAERTALATKAGVGTGYTGTADQNAKIVSYLNTQKAGTTPASSGVPTPPPAPTTTDFSKFTPQANTELNNANDAYQTAVTDTGIPTQNERQYATDMFQKEIDALNQVYAQQKQAAIVVGQNRLGSAGAIQARRGLLGSDFGAAQDQGVIAANTEEQNAIDAKHSADIGAILGKVSQAAIDMADKRVKAATAGATAKLEEIKGRQADAKNAVTDAVKAYLAGGNDGTKLSTAEINSWIDTFKKQGINISANDITNAVTDQVKAKQKELDAAAKENADVTKPFEQGGYIYQYDPATKAYKNIGTKANTSSTGGPLSILDIQRYQELYPNAGILPGDSETIANAKVNKGTTGTNPVSNLITAAKTAGNSYDTVVNEINNDPSITDKATAKAEADKIYGVTATPPSKIDTEIQSLKDYYSKIPAVKNVDYQIEKDLQRKGYSPQEIANSSVGSVLDRTINSISDALFK